MGDGPRIDNGNKVQGVDGQGDKRNFLTMRVVSSKVPSASYT